MAYSHTRLRKTLALIRIATGFVFVFTGAFKISSLEFGRELFPTFLDSGIRGAAAEWFRPVLEWVVSYGPARIGISLGFLELFIGVALILGLAVRVASAAGVLYTAGLLFATWNLTDSTPSMLQSSEHQFRNLFPCLIFVLLGVGHAGETWGVGALYHRHRDRRWARDAEREAQRTATDVEAEREPTSFEEFAEMEARAAREKAPEQVPPAEAQAEEEEEKQNSDP